MALIITEEDLKNPEVLGEKLFVLSEIVISRHFYASSSQYFDDMRSVGTLKAYTMAVGGYFDSKKGNLTSFFYGGIRNEIHNFLYRENKHEHSDIDVLIDQGDDDSYFVEDKVYISYSIIHSICMSFMKTFGENIENLVIKRLEDMEFTVKGRKEKDSPAFVYCYDPIVEEYGKEAEEEIISRLVGLILWKRREHENRA